MERTADFDSGKVRILLAQNAGNSIVVLFENGQQFTYTAAVLYSVIPKDDVIARPVESFLWPRSDPKANLSN
jgi:hypothetical protein